MSSAQQGPETSALATPAAEVCGWSLSAPRCCRTVPQRTAGAHQLAVLLLRVAEPAAHLAAHRRASPQRPGRPPPPRHPVHCGWARHRTRSKARNSLIPSFLHLGKYFSSSTQTVARHTAAYLLPIILKRAELSTKDSIRHIFRDACLAVVSRILKLCVIPEFWGPSTVQRPLRL